MICLRRNLWEFAKNCNFPSFSDYLNINFTIFYNFAINDEVNRKRFPLGMIFHIRLHINGITCH